MCCLISSLFPSLEQDRCSLHCLLMCINLCTCQGSSASYSNIHELGRYWITNSAPPLSVKGKKGKRQRREGQSHNSGREEGGRKRPLWQQQHPRLLYAHEAFLNKYPVFVLESAHHSPNRYDSPLALLIRHNLIKKKKKKHWKPPEDSWAMTDR